MYRKNCDRCKRPSFSSCEQGEWLCPVCGNDLTSYPFFLAGTFEKRTALPSWIKGVYSRNELKRKSDTSLWG